MLDLSTLISPSQYFSAIDHATTREELAEIEADLESYTCPRGQFIWNKLRAKQEHLRNVAIAATFGVTLNPSW